MKRPGTPGSWFTWPPGRAVTLQLLICWCCGSPRVKASSRGPLCGGCYDRWRARGFAGSGPGPHVHPPMAGSAREYADTITRQSAQRAAIQLGVSRRTVQRWRAVLREAS